MNTLHFCQSSGVTLNAFKVTPFTDAIVNSYQQHVRSKYPPRRKPIVCCHGNLVVYSASFNIDSTHSYPLIVCLTLFITTWVGIVRCLFLLEIWLLYSVLNLINAVKSERRGWSKSMCGSVKNYEYEQPSLAKGNTHAPQCSFGSEESACSDNCTYYAQLWLQLLPWLPWSAPHFPQVHHIWLLCGTFATSTAIILPVCHSCCRCAKIAASAPIMLHMCV